MYLSSLPGKPRLSPYIQAEIPMLRCLYQEVDHYVTSVLVEIFNNEPNLSENDPIMSELLSHIINKGKVCGINLKANRKKQTQSYSHKINGVFKVSECRAAQDILQKTRFPKFLCHPPCSFCRILKNTLKRTTTNTSRADTDFSERPKHWIEALISPLGRQNQPKQTKDPVAETKVIEIAGERVEGGKVIKSPLAGRTDVRKTIRNTEIYVSPERRLEFHTGQRIDRKLQYAMVKRNRMFSRISFEIGRETHTILVNITATESFWRLMQRLLNSFQLHRPATKRLEYKRSTDAVIRYRPNEWTTNITVDHLEFGSLTITSVPVSVLKLLLHMFNRSFRAVCDPSAVVGRYQVPEICRYRLTSKRVHLRNESHRIYNDNLRDTLQLKHGFSFWRYFPRVRDINIVCKSSTAVLENDTTAAKEEDSKITNEIHASGTKAISETILYDGSYSLSEHSTKIIEDMHTNLDIPGDQRTRIYDAETKDVHANLEERDVCISLDTEDKGAAAPSSFADEYAKAKEGAKAKDYQTFNVQVPDNLLHIKIPFIDITELEFEKDMDGNRAILVSGGFGDIFHASLSTTGEEMVVKIVKNMTFEDVLRETRIQKYLMTSVSVPMLVGIIGGPDYAETMIVQQMCAKGKQVSRNYTTDGREFESRYSTHFKLYRLNFVIPAALMNGLHISWSQRIAGFYQALRLLNGFMLNSAEHEICPAIKSLLLLLLNAFLLNIAEHKNSLINIKMPTIKHENNIPSGPDFKWSFSLKRGTNTRLQIKPLQLRFIPLLLSSH